jgi:hypothetical protein
VKFVASFLILTAHLLYSQDTAGVGALSGIVQNSSKTPVPGVSLCLASTTTCTQSDAQGHFRFTGLRPSTYIINVKSANIELKTDPIQVRAGIEERFEISLPTIESNNQSLTVSESAAYIVSGKDIFKNAGSLQDVSRFVQVLPGVAIGSNDFRNDIIVRGGSPLENLFVVDNIEVPNINSFANFASAGGTVGILDANLLEDATFLTGGFPAAYLNRTSSVLQITQREGDRNKFGGRATLGFAGAGLIFEGPLGKSKKGSFVTSFRRTFIDLFTDDVGFGGVPVAYTSNTKLLYDLSSRDRVWLVNLTGVDNIRLGPADGQSAADREEEVTNLDIRYKGRRSATGFNWQRTFSTRSIGLLGLTYSAATNTSSVKDLLSTTSDIPLTGNLDDLIARSTVRYREE